jgi:hypothetical protein
MMRRVLLTVAMAAATAGVAGQSYQPIHFGQLSNYEFEVPDPLNPPAAPIQNVIPPAVKSLDGRMVSLEGFMLPIDLTPEGVSMFMLNASIDMCYFGAPVRINDWVMVRMKAGKRAKFTHLATTVKGRFEVGEDVRNGRVVSLYRLEADSAEADGR